MLNKCWSKKILKRILKGSGYRQQRKEIGFDKSRWSVSHCQRMRKLCQECRTPRNQDNRNRKPTRRTVPVEETTSNALVSQCDGFGYDWSDQAEEGPTNFALMAYSSTSSSSSTNSEVSNDSNCCSSCLECVKNLKEQNEQLVKDLRTARISVVSYKTGLESVEARLLVFKKNKSVYEEDIKLLKCEIYLRDLDLQELKRQVKSWLPERKDEVSINSNKNLKIIKKAYSNFWTASMDNLDDFVDVNESVSESIVEKPTIETYKPKTDMKENGAPIIGFGVLIRDEENVPRPKAVLSAFKGNKGNAVKASTCWIQTIEDEEQEGNVEVPGNEIVRGSKYRGAKEDNVVDENIVYGCADDPNMPELEDIVYSDDDEDVGAEADMNNLDAFMPVSPIPTIRIHKDHPIEQIIRDLISTYTTKNEHMNMNSEHAMFSSVQQRTNHKDARPPYIIIVVVTIAHDIMFAVCDCARFQVNPKISHLHAVKRIFRYLKGQPKLGRWYPKDSLFDLVAYTDSDCAGASLDRKSTT
ncbi:hypothetical protein Tco_0652936 [Tanacetum coccineum]|uniref:Reverse transcriptase Ty1/copia-type domain-containing protein n=1 Tax=Tanacetum coccineum TaxID=301880 RepID=A0ABQ4WZ10_9ASTR